MLRGKPHLLKYMPEPKDARRLVPDPENEPDFYAIEKDFPLARDLQLSLPRGFLSTHVSTHGLMQPRLASEVNRLVDSLPGSKRLKCDDVIYQDLAFNAAGQPFLSRQGATMNVGPMIPTPVVSNTNEVLNDLLLLSLIQQLGPNSQVPLPSSPISVLDLLRQRQQFGYM